VPQLKLFKRYNFLSFPFNIALHSSDTFARDVIAFRLAIANLSFFFTLCLCAYVKGVVSFFNITVKNSPHHDLNCLTAPGRSDRHI